MQSSWPCESARSLCSMSKSLWCGLTQVHNNSMEHFLDVFEWCRLVVVVVVVVNYLFIIFFITCMSTIMTQLKKKIIRWGINGLHHSIISFQRGNRHDLEHFDEKRKDTNNWFIAMIKSWYESIDSDNRMLATSPTGVHYIKGRNRASLWNKNQSVHNTLL